MKESLYSNAFFFNRFRYTKYHYTDSRAGCPMYYLGCMIKGHCKIVSERTTIEAYEGELFFIPKNLKYESYWYGEDIVELLSFGFHGLGTEDDMNYELQVIPSESSLVNRVMSVSVRERRPSLGTLSVFYAVMEEIQPLLKHTGGRDEHIVKTAQNYITSHNSCTVADIARACRISEPYLYVIIRRRLGITPNELKCRILCRLGAELLTTTDKTVEEISTRLGFSSASYFRRVLKKYMGMTPKEIRREGGV